MVADDTLQNTGADPVERPIGRRTGRPRQALADAETRQRLIRTGLIFLTERGYSSVGIDEMLREARVTKGSFYHYFPSKAAFGAELVTVYRDYFAVRLNRWFQDQSLTPLDRLKAFVADAERGMARHAFRRGCLVGNLGQEMGALPEEFRSRLSQALEDWQTRTAACLRLAQAQGQIAARHDPEALAVFFWIGWEGAVLRAKLERRGTPLTVFADGFFSTLCH